LKKAGAFCLHLPQPHGRDQTHYKNIPATAKLTLLRETCNFIPEVLVAMMSGPAQTQTPQRAGVRWPQPLYLAMEMI
jgi:hypothetical protein